MKPIDIQGGYPLVVVTFDCASRSNLATFAAQWAAQHASAAWCIAPDPRGEIEVTFALPKDRTRFREALGMRVAGASH